MNRAPITKLTDALRTMMVAIADIKDASKEVIAQTDNRATLETFQTDMHTTLQAFTDKDVLVANTVPHILEQLAAVLYFQEREAILGKQSDEQNPGFRKVFDDTRHPIKAVVALRTMYPGVDLREARLIIEAYRDGIFK